MEGSERETILRSDQIVKKDSAQINLRGEIDSLYAQALFTCAYARQYGYTDILSGLEDIVKAVRAVMTAEATDKAPEISHIIGLDFDELRRISNNPKAELGIEHIIPDELTTDDMTALINVLRTRARQAERAAAAACEADDTISNEAVLTTLNRLSSAAYILMLEHIAARRF